MAHFRINLRINKNAELIIPTTKDHIILTEEVTEKVEGVLMTRPNNAYHLTTREKIIYVAYIHK